MSTSHTTLESNESSVPVGRTLALRQLSDQEWASVPGTLPQTLLGLAVWIPLGSLIFFLIGSVGDTFMAGHKFTDFISYSLLSGLIVMMWGGGRLSPLLSVGVTGYLCTLAGFTPMQHRVVVAALCYFIVLTVVVGLLDLRFRSLLRRWQREATSNLNVPRQQLRALGFFKQLPGRLWALTLSALVVPVARLGWQYISSEVHTVADLDFEQRLNILLGTGLILVCLLLSAFKWLGARALGLCAFQIPVDRTLGPMSYTLVGQAILSAVEEGPGCNCREADKNSTSKTFVDDAFIFASDGCPSHGIDAVNALSREGFVKIAHQPWVYGKNLTGALMNGRRESLVCVGASGWDYRPVRVPTTWLYDGRTAANGYLMPGKLREPVHRANRQLTVVDPLGDTFLEDEFDQDTMTPVDRIDLRHVGIDARVIRVAGHRPFLQD